MPVWVSCLSLTGRYTLNIRLDPQLPRKESFSLSFSWLGRLPAFFHQEVQKFPCWWQTWHSSWSHPGGHAGSFRAAWLVLGRCLVRGTRPNRRQCSPAAAPRGDRGCRLKLARLGCWLVAARRSRAGSCCSARGGRGRGNSWQLQLRAPELQLQPRAGPLLPSAS